MRTQALLVSFFLVAGSLAGCADPTLVCGGEGKLVDGQCFQPSADESAPDAIASPRGGRFPEPVNVLIHAGEAATVYYAFDDEPLDLRSKSAPSPVHVSDVEGLLSFFAVDAAGNRPLFVTSERYEIDRTGPNVSDIVAHPPDGLGNVVVAWSLPTSDDAEGVLVVRDRHDPPSWEPARGTRYDSGQHVADGVQVLHAGDASSEIDLNTAGGESHYHAWGIDDLVNYAETPASTVASGTLGINEATLLISLTARTVTVAKPPVDYAISVSGNFHADGQTVTLQVAIKNLVDRPVFNVKAYLDDVSSGTTVAQESSLGFTLMHFGIAAIQPGETVVREFTLKDADPLVPVQVNMPIRADPVVVLPSEKGGARAVDSGDATFAELLDCTVISYPLSNFGGCAFEGWVWGADYRVAYAGSRNAPVVAVIDADTWTATLGVSLDDREGHVPDLAMSVDGQTLFAPVVTGAHRRTNRVTLPIEIDLVVLERESLIEQARIPLERDLTFGESRGGVVAMSPDGQTLAAVFRGLPRLHLVSTSEHTLRTVDLGTFIPLSVAVSADSQFAYAASLSNANILQIDLDTLAVTTLFVAGDRVGALVADAERLYIASKGSVPGLFVYDFAQGTTASYFPGERITALSLSPDARTLYAVSRDLFRVQKLNLLTLTEDTPIVLQATARGHNIGVTP